MFVQPFLLSILHTATGAQPGPCTLDCTATVRECVQTGHFCTEDSFYLFQTSLDGELEGTPCTSNADYSKTSACYICDTGPLPAPVGQVNRRCIKNVCVETTQVENGICCDDFEMKNGKHPTECSVESQGKFCKPGLLCKDWNTTTRQGTCKNQTGARPWLGYMEDCVIRDSQTLQNALEEIAVCYGDGLTCAVDGVAPGSEAPGQSGHCKALNATGNVYLPAGQCNIEDSGLQCDFGKICRNGACVTSGYLNADKNCTSHNDCGHGMVCIWKTWAIAGKEYDAESQAAGVGSEPAAHGTCGLPFQRAKGQWCDDRLTCGAGMYCNYHFRPNSDTDFGVCDTAEKMCDIYSPCGRGMTTGCPDPNFVPTPGADQRCRDGPAKEYADRQRYLYNAGLKALYDCFQEAKVPHDSSLRLSDMQNFKSFRGSACRQNLGSPFKNDLLLTLRKDGITAPPACGAAESYGGTSQMALQSGAAQLAPTLLVLLPATILFLI
eukprot:g25770.t1